MRVTFQTGRLLCAFACLSIAQPCAAKEEEREVKFRVLCLEHQDDVKIAKIATGKGKGSHEIRLLAASISEQYEAKFEAETATFFVDDREAPKKRRAVASGKLAEGDQQVFVLLPDNDGKMPYRLLALNDDEKSFPMGNIRVINIYSSPIRLNIGDTDLEPIPAGEHASYPPAESVDEWDMFPVRVDLGSPDGKWYPAASPSWKRSKLKRDIVVINLDKRSMQPRVIVIKDIPPWRKANLGDE